MQRLDISAVRQWGRTGNLWHPKSVSTVCHCCGEPGVFSLTDFSVDTQRLSVSSSGKCPGCKNMMNFWIVDASNSGEEQHIGILMVHPDPGQSRQCLEVGHLMPKRVMNAYQEAVDVYRGKNWNATASMCRRTLEGLLSEILPDEKRRGSLADQIEKLKEHMCLVGPLVAVSDSLRKCGNIGSHFDEKIDADEHIASALLDFIDYLVEYLYVLPDSTGKLKTRLSELDSSD